MCKDPYFNAQICRLLVIVNVILCLFNVFFYLATDNTHTSILHAVFNLLIAAWMLKAFNYYKSAVINESRKTR